MLSYNKIKWGNIILRGWKIPKETKFLTTNTISKSIQYYIRKEGS
jgi:hypothetical protein